MVRGTFHGGRLVFAVVVVLLLASLLAGLALSA